MAISAQTVKKFLVVCGVIWAFGLSAQTSAAVIWDLGVGGPDVQEITVFDQNGGNGLAVSAYTGNPATDFNTVIRSNSTSLGVGPPNNTTDPSCSFNNAIDNGTGGAACTEFLSFDIDSILGIDKLLSVTLRGLGGGERAYIGGSDNPTVDGFVSLVPLIGTSTVVAGSSATLDTFLFNPGSLPKYLIVGADRTLPSGNTRFRVQQIVAVPEPATLALIGLGFAGIGYQRRRLMRVR
ncbi:MAG: PEP-CTERM sorting domain-containing protein [Thiohalocapsa sp.]